MTGRFIYFFLLKQFFSSNIYQGQGQGWPVTNYANASIGSVIHGIVVVSTSMESSGVGVVIKEVVELAPLLMQSIWTFRPIANCIC